MDKKTRKPNRLPDFDYSSDGYYFITICTFEKQKILCNIVGDGVLDISKAILSDIGKIVETAIRNIKIKYNDVTIDKYVIMPNHIHFIVCISNGSAMHSPTISNIVSQMKGYVTKQIGFSIWQKSFYDHIIRNEKDYLKIWNYIDTNIQKWAEDKYYFD